MPPWRTNSGAHEPRERLPRASKSRNWSKLVQAGLSSTTSPATAAARAAASARSSVPAATTTTPAAAAPASAAPICGPSSPIRYTARARATTSSRSMPKSWPLPRPPRIRCTLPAANDRSATSVLATLVAFESLTNSTPSRLATSSRRCATPAKVDSASRTPSAGSPQAERRRRAGHRVLHVVRPSQADRLERHEPLPPPPEPSAVAAQVGRGIGAERQSSAEAGQINPDAGRRDDRNVIAALAGEQPQLGRQIGIHVAVAVEVVGREVEQHRRVRRELDGILELERRCFADHGDRRGERRLAVRRGRRKQAQRPPDVPGDDRVAATRAIHRADQLDGRRLAVGAGDGDELVGQQAPCQLQLADHRDPPLACRDDHRLRGGDTRALDDAAHPLEHADPVRHQLDPGRRELARRKAGTIGADHLLPARAQRQRRCDPRARQPDDQVGAPGQRRAAHLIECE